MAMGEATKEYWQTRCVSAWRLGGTGRARDQQVSLLNFKHRLFVALIDSSIFDGTLT